MDKCQVISNEQGNVTIDNLTNVNSIPFRIRGIQTEQVLTEDVGIQCKLDEEDDEDDEDWFTSKPAIESTEDTNEETKFRLYVSQRTNQFPNGMLGCLLCGEVAKEFVKHQRHMELHYGPQTLCSDCGQLIKHEHLLEQHKYRCRARANPKSQPQMHMQCPHLQCSYVITSKRQLRWHLRNHLTIKEYHCLQCRQRFSSCAQFLVHRMLSSTCKQAKHYFLSKNSAKSRHKSKINRCSICLRLFSNAYRCLLHSRRCIQKYQRRLRQLLIRRNKMNKLHLA
ncbi:zinc finger protein 691 [Drosophila hydei]|uniref:Zinc finger protein 691 n=1 Tax=Drosophila hydei TaxID=7224 RepID=A0A6J1LLB0_DROHY|nr:zinc finger protein 691 [Drosophila hydei]